MTELLKAIRNAIIAMLLAWIGVSFSEPAEDSEPVDEPTTVSFLQR